jgi:hypothetical protein
MKGVLMSATETQVDVKTPAEEKEPRLPTGDNTPVEEYIPNYTVEAIILMIFCCLPMGIVALVYAAQVNGLILAKEYDRAREASQNARTWCWISFWSGSGPLSIYILSVILAVALG